jgi:hypothetical protein
VLFLLEVKEPPFGLIVTAYELIVHCAYKVTEAFVVYEPPELYPVPEPS